MDQSSVDWSVVETVIARCQVGNKVMKTKLTKMLRGKERKKTKNRSAKLNKGR